MKKLILLALLVVASTFGALLLETEKAYAATGQVVDRATIKIGSRVFFDRDIDANFNYEEQNPTDRCADIIKGFSNGDLEGTNTPSSATLEVRTPRPNNNEDCDPRNENITFGDSRSNFIKAFVWIDENTIQGADGNMVFTRDGGSNTFSDANSEDRCVDTLTISSNNRTATLQEREFERRGNHEYHWFPFTITDREKNDSSGCFESDSVSGVQLAGTPDSGNDGAAPGAGGSDAVENEDSCESQGALGWIICPVIYLLDNVTSFLDNQVESLLRVPENDARDTGLYEAWSIIRNIAYTILVPAMLIMVISTALGFDFIDAYTVKRALPRLFLAVIFIALSWELTNFLITISNVVGVGVKGLITSPFNAGNIGIRDIISEGEGFGASSIGAGTVGWAVLAGKLSFGIVASYAFVAAIGLLLAFLVLVARQVFILALVLVAPIAILAWIFPGNDKLWNGWWSLFSKLLLMFPLIMALLAIGKVFAYVGGISQEGPIGTLIKLAAYIMPYFFIPATFKFAGGVFGTVTGAVNDRTRGLFDKQRKYRQEQREALKERATTDGRFNPNTRFGRSRLGKKINSAASYAASPYKSAAYANKGRSIPFLSAKGRQLAGSVENTSIEQSQKVMQRWNANGANDKFYRAVGGMYQGFTNDTKLALAAAGMADATYKRNADGSFATNEQGQRIVSSIKARKSLKSERDFQQMANILSTSDSDSERKAAVALQANKAFTSSMYDDPEFNYANTAAAASMGLAAHGFFDGRDAADLHSLVKDELGSDSFAHTATVTAQNIGKGSHPENKPGYGHEIVNGEAIDGMDPRSDRGWAVAATLSPQDYYGMKGDVLVEDRFGGILTDMLKAGRDGAGKFETMQKLQNAGLDDNAIQQRLSKADTDFDSIKSTLFSVAGPYSGASAGVRTQAANIIKNAGLMDDFDRYRGSVNPAVASEGVQGAAASQPPEDIAGGGKPPGGT